MARTLDARFFDLLERRVEDGFEYQAYRVIRPTSTMVLFSTTVSNTPIAAFSFWPRSSGTNAKTVLTRRDTDLDGNVRFQGLMNIDNDEFELGIHNLTDVVREPHTSLTHGRRSDLGYVKIDVLGHDVPVNDVDLPDVAVNQVNELAPSQSYVIQCDQRTGNRTMVLRGCNSATTGGAVSVRQDDAATAEHERAGTYFYINVVATAAFPEMAEWLLASTWRVVDVFVRRIPHMNGRMPRQRGAYLPYMHDESDGPRATIQTQSFAMPASLLCGSMSYAPRTLSNSTCVAATPSSQQVLDSQVGAVVSGSQHIDVRFGETGQSYVYSAPGERVCLGLSVWRDMHLLETPTRDELREEAQMQLRDAAENHGRDLIALLTKVFRADECTICFEKEPNVVFYACGHQCVCTDCLTDTNVQRERRCFLCRAPIVARLAL